MRQIRDLPVAVAWELALQEAWATFRGGRPADLSGSDLRGSNLSGSDLSGSIDGAIVRLDMGGWSVCVRSTETSIGCETHSNEDWLRWTPENVAYMDPGAADWWSAHGDLIRAAIRDVQARSESGGGGE